MQNKRKLRWGSDAPRVSKRSQANGSNDKFGLLTIRIGKRSADPSLYSQGRSPAPVILGGVAPINTISLGVVCLHPSWRYRDSPQRSGDFRRCTIQETGPLDILQHIPQGDFAGGSTEVVAPSGATKGADQTILGQLTPDALSWEGVSSDRGPSPRTLRPIEERLSKGRCGGTLPL